MSYPLWNPRVHCHVYNSLSTGTYPEYVRHNANFLEGGFYFERNATLVTRSENLSKEDFINRDTQTSYTLSTKRLKQSESGCEGKLCCKQSSVNNGHHKSNISRRPKTSNRINEQSTDALSSLYNTGT